VTATPMEICPLCAMCPRLAGRWRLQVRCGCGARGPRRKSPAEAIGRWNSIVSFVRDLQAKGIAAAHAPARRVARRLAAQCGLEPYQGC
jgi:hypothetical protein